MSYGIETMKQKLEFTVPKVGSDEYGLGTRWHVLNLRHMKEILSYGKIALSKEDFNTNKHVNTYIKVDPSLKIEFNATRSTTTQKAYISRLLIEGNTVTTRSLLSWRESNNMYGLMINSYYFNSNSLVTESTYSIQTKGYNIHKIADYLKGSYISVSSFLSFFYQTLQTDANTGLGSTFYMGYYSNYYYDSNGKLQNRPEFTVRFRNLYQNLNLTWFKHER